MKRCSKRIIKKCLYCRKRIIVRKSVEERKKFCSHSCSTKWQNRNNQSVGFKKGHKSYVEKRKGKTYEEIFGVLRAKEMKKKMAIKKLGHIPWNKNSKGIMKANQTSFKKGLKPWNTGIKGEKSHSWINGNSFEPYSYEFFMKREKIRMRDNYQCQLCGRTKEEEFIGNGRKLSVHHIDYNKRNNSDDNLITLCDSCHQRIKGKNRKYWEEKIQEIRDFRYNIQLDFIKS